MSQRHGGLVWFLLLSLALAAVRTSGQTTEAAAEEDVPCVDAKGNNDMYGLGIRIGVYLQALALALATLFEQPSYRGIVFATIWFQLSMLVGVVYLTVTDDALEVVDVMVINIFMMFWSVSTFPTLFGGDGPPKLLSGGGLQMLLGDGDDLRMLGGDDDLRVLGGVLRMLFGRGLRMLLDGGGPPRWSRVWVVPFVKSLIDLGYFAHSVWFWFVGIDVLVHTPCTAKYGYGMYGSWRTVGKISAVSMVVVYLYFPLRMLGVVKFPGSWRTTTAKVAATEPAEEGGTASVRQAPRPRQWPGGLMCFYVTMVAIALFFAGIWVMLVERTIQVNHITGIHTINTVGQLIPFLTGVGSFLSIFLDWKPPQVKCTERGGPFSFFCMSVGWRWWL
jgi:hypothetical protein